SYRACCAAVIQHPRAPNSPVCLVDCHLLPGMQEVRVDVDREGNDALDEVFLDQLRVNALSTAASWRGCGTRRGSAGLWQPLLLIPSCPPRTGRNTFQAPDREADRAHAAAHPYASERCASGLSPSGREPYPPRWRRRHTAGGNPSLTKARSGTSYTD